MIADLAPDQAKDACRRVGWANAGIESTRFTDNVTKLLAAPDLEIVVEATGHAPAGITHARGAIANPAAMPANCKKFRRAIRRAPAFAAHSSHIVASRSCPPSQRSVGGNVAKS